jgi:hypothetical protein
MATAQGGGDSKLFARVSPLPRSLPGFAWLSWGLRGRHTPLNSGDQLSLHCLASPAKPLTHPHGDSHLPFLPSLLPPALPAASPEQHHSSASIPFPLLVPSLPLPPPVGLVLDSALPRSLDTMSLLAGPSDRHGHVPSLHSPVRSLTNAMATGQSRRAALRVE